MINIEGLKEGPARARAPWAYNLGVFIMDNDIISMCDDATRLIMASCVIIQASQCNHNGIEHAHYFAASPYFDPPPPGMSWVKVPQYKWTITRTEPLGQLTLKAVRQ